VTAAQHCKRVGLGSVKALARFHNVTVWTVNHWRREQPELFDRKLAEAAVNKLAEAAVMKSKNNHEQRNARP